MVKKLAVLVVAMSAFAVQASDKVEPTEKAQKKLIKQAEKHIKKDHTDEACKAYGEAFKMGYLGDKEKQTDPKENQLFVKAATGLADCLTSDKEQSVERADLKGANIYFNLKKFYSVEGMDQKLTDLQAQKLKEASILEQSKADDFKSEDPKITKACQSAELGYQIGFLGTEDQRKDATINRNFVGNGVYHAACISLNPKFHPKGDANIANLISYSILKNLAVEYNNKLAQDLVAPADAIIAKAEEAKKAKLEAEKSKAASEQAKAEAEKAQKTTAKKKTSK